MQFQQAGITFTNETQPNHFGEDPSVLFTPGDRQGHLIFDRRLDPDFHIDHIFDFYPFRE